MRGLRKLALLLALALPLQSCSSSYTVIAKVIGGRIAFVSGDDDHECISIIRVISEGPRAPDPAIDNLQDPVAKGDAITRARAAWIADGISNDCFAHYPIYYGSKLPGIPDVIPPRKLRIGEPYSVSVMGPRGSGGDGCFRINAQRRVENLDYRECSTAGPMPPQPAMPVVTTIFPVQARATPAAYLKPGDIPAGALPKQGEVMSRFVLDVGKEGRATGCTIVEPSGSAALDSIICRVMRERATFTAATSSNSFQTDSRIEQEIVWTPAGAKNIPSPGDRQLGADLNVWEESSNIVRTVGRYESMLACQTELGRMAARGPAVGEKAFCFFEPATEFTPAGG